MVCDFCHERNAVIFLEQLSANGQRRKINICMECAVERGISSDPKSIEASIVDLFKELAVEKSAIRAAEIKACPVCGTSGAEIRRTGKAGCPECYSGFKADIRKFLERHGVSGAYTGSFPERLGNSHSVLSDRVELKTKLDEAVAQEDYERAAMYRDYLKALDGNFSSGPDESEE